MFYQPLLTQMESYVVSVSTDARGFKAHLHHEIEILYCLSGHRQLLLDGVPYELHPGDAVAVGSMVTHELLPTDECTHLLVEFGPMLLRERFTPLAKLKMQPPVLHRAAHPRIFAVLDALAAGRSAPPDALETIGQLYRLAAALTEIYGAAPAAGAPLQEKRRIENALELIYQYYATPLTLDAAAKASGYAKGTFCANFKRATGMSFHQYLIAYRITTAQFLLQTTDWSVEQVGESVGYVDARSFCRAFKETVRVTPMQFRRGQTHQNSGTEL